MIDATLLLSADDSAAFMGISRRQFFKLRSEGKLPQPIYLSARTVRYRRDDLVAAVEKLTASTPAGEPAQLRRARGSV